MIKIDYEEYYCDYMRKYYSKTFATLQELEDWIFGQMQRPYSDQFAMWFPRAEAIDHIQFQPSYKSADYWIHQITYNGQCVFSDGRLTNGEKFMSTAIANWCEKCKQRRMAKPKFTDVGVIE